MLSAWTLVLVLSIQKNLSIDIEIYHIAGFRNEAACTEFGEKWMTQMKMVYEKNTTSHVVHTFTCGEM